MARFGKTRRIFIVAAVIVLAGLSLPFLIERRRDVYTDGRELRAPEDLVRRSVRRVLWEDPRALEPGVNHAELADYEPRVSPHGDLLVFTRGRPGEGADLWFAEREGGRWRSPSPMEDVNSDADDLGAAFTKDGLWLLFYSNRDGGLGGYDVWASPRVDDGWGEPLNPGPAINSSWNEMNPAPGPRGELYFTSDRRAGHDVPPRWKGTVRAHLRASDYDLFVAEPAAGETIDEEPELDEPRAGNEPSTGTFPPEMRFAKAAPLEALNRRGGAEGTPAVSPFGDFLYFASNRPGGEGGFDLYRVRFLDGALGPVESLGPQVNTPADELDPALSSGGYELYFSRARAGQEDIFLSFSREVYLTAESEGTYWSFSALLAWLADLLARVPPALLALLLALLLAALILLLFRRWLLSPSVLARSFLVALLIHLLIGLWMHRNTVRRMLLESFDAPEAYEALELDIEGAPEETVALAIREATAETEHDAAPSLGGELRPLERPPLPERRRPLLEEVHHVPLEPELDPLAAPVAELPPPEPRAAASELPPPVEPRLVEPDPPSPSIAMRGILPPAEPEEEARRIDLLGERPARSPARSRLAVEASEPLEEAAPAARSAADLAREAEPRRLAAPLPPITEPRKGIELELPPSRVEESSSAPEIAARAVSPPPEEEGGEEAEADRALELARRPVSRDEHPLEPRDDPTPALQRGTPEEPELDAPRPALSLLRVPRPLPSAGVPAVSDVAVVDAPVASSSTGDAPPLEIRPRELREGTRPSAPESPSLALERARRPAPLPRATGESRPGRELRPVRATRASPAAEVSRGSRREELAARLAPRLSRTASLPGEIVPEAAPGVGHETTYVPGIYELRARPRRRETLLRGGGSPETERAVEAGLAWLALHQSPDGRWTLDRFHRHLAGVSPRDLRHPDWNGRGRKSSLGGSGRARNGDTAATGLALLAFLGHGDTHLEEGPYREVVDRGLRWLVSRQRRDGDLRDGGNLYMHGVAAFALAEAYAFTRDPRLREPAERALAFTVRSQVPAKGGWKYEPYPESSEADTSVFGWMLMALKSAHLGGLEVDRRCLERAWGFLESVRKRGEPGLFVYEPGRGTKRTDLAMTAQGFFSQLMLSEMVFSEEERRSPELRRLTEASIRYLLSNLPRAEDMDGVNFYYWYYATLALFQVDGPDGLLWRRWNEALKDVLIEHQVGEDEGSAKGSWDPRGYRAEIGGRLYSTALSILCLEVYYRYAPLEAR